ncbi:YgaP-like transmembrane domain [Marinilactibacillus psychrotolerans]|uniref:YgaP-like transmembrane domain n=1 Tax=Marinilactibacillus psychrotolerans TaxID=191770 RepID=UPI00388A8D23
MDKNVGELDSTIRIIFGAALAPLLLFTKGIGKIVGIFGIVIISRFGVHEYPFRVRRFTNWVHLVF